MAMPLEGGRPALHRAVRRASGGFNRTAILKRRGMREELGVGWWDRG